MTDNQRHCRLFYRRQKPGTAPGTLVPPEGAAASRVHVMAWNEDEIEEFDIKNDAGVESLPSLLKRWPVVWINVDGLGSTALIEKFGEVFGLHPLALEDVLHTHQRSKTDDYDDHIFTVTRMARLIDDNLDSEQISIFLGKKFVLTFQERPGGDCLDPVRERVRHGKGRRIKFSNADYLVYAIIDAIVDGYFPVLEYYGEKLNELEDRTIENPHHDLVHEIHEIKRDLRVLRHGAWPMREMVSGLTTSGSGLVRDKTLPYLRDCHDHIIQVMDLLETNRERASALIDIYLSSITHRTNEIMRVLTIIATIFIPLSFIASVYGMNFDTAVSPWNMPELEWAYGYLFALALMAGVAGGLLNWFWRKGWLGLPARKKTQSE